MVSRFGEFYSVFILYITWHPGNTVRDRLESLALNERVALPLIPLR
jgi:hypothetical protein